MKNFVLGGGCFWCLDAVYQNVKGVTEVVSGYAGGARENPSYEQVCSGAPGHAEVVAVTFDETVISEDVILDMFFVLHDPTQLNRQGNDVGTQYRSVMFYRDAEQKRVFEAASARADLLWPGEIVTEISPLPEFYEAEEYHQNFFAKNPGQGYCLAVAVPKVNKVRGKFTEYML